MNFETSPKTKEASRTEGDAVEAGFALLKAALVVRHFWGEKKDEIKSAVEQAKKGTGNPALFLDNLGNAVSKFVKIVGDYEVETEEARAALQQETIDNLTKGKERLEILKKERSKREADLLDILSGRKRETPKTPQGAEKPKEDSTEEYEETSKPAESASRGPKASPEKKPDDSIRKETVKAPEVKKFSTEFIKDRVRTFLASNKNIKEVKNIEVKGNGNEITLNLRVLAGPLGSEVGVQAVLESKAGTIKVKSHKIDAGWMIKGAVEGIIVPKLNEVSGILESYIEKEENKKVEKMEIINGELIVSFK